MAYNLGIIIYWCKEDKLYIAEVPALAGRKSDGHTYIAAISNIEMIIDEWLKRLNLLVGKYQR